MLRSFHKPKFIANKEKTLEHKKEQKSMITLSSCCSAQACKSVWTPSTCRLQLYHRYTALPDAAARCSGLMHAGGVPAELPSCSELLTNTRTQAVRLQPQHVNIFNTSTTEQRLLIPSALGELPAEGRLFHGLGCRKSPDPAESFR